MSRHSAARAFGAGQTLGQGCGARYQNRCTNLSTLDNKLDQLTADSRSAEHQPVRSRNTRGDNYFHDRKDKRNGILAPPTRLFGMTGAFGDMIDADTVSLNHAE